ncbi:MAG: hypothetical protein Q8O84_01350 [Nanoarchaeota archaeon]|nr:hypothetical protein [Nanoarchaeota archaeon]
MTNEYNPKLGDANRYENARTFNRNLAEKINQEALSIVKTAMPVLEKVELNPQNKYFHDAIAGSMWMGHYLQDKNTEILRDLYGMSCINSLEKATNVPQEILSFINRTKNITL